MSGDGADGAAAPALLVDGEGGRGVRRGVGDPVAGSAAVGVVGTRRGEARRLQAPARARCVGAATPAILGEQEYVNQVLLDPGNSLVKKNMVEAAIRTA